MGQQDVIDVLMKNLGVELTSTDIANFLNKENNVAIRNAIKRLLKDVSINIKFRHLTLEEKKEKFGHIVNPKIAVYWMEG